MSTPPQGRALSFPIIWDRSRARCVSVPETPVVQCPSDEEVMALLRASDSNALNLLFDRHSRLVLGIALRILHDHGEAEGIVQEAFFQVFQKANLFDPSKGTAKAWIVQIAFHRTLDRKSYQVLAGRTKRYIPTSGRAGFQFPPRATVSPVPSPAGAGNRGPRRRVRVRGTTSVRGRTLFVSNKENSVVVACESGGRRSQSLCQIA